jgi:hypothetical protein
MNETIFYNGFNLLIDSIIFISSGAIFYHLAYRQGYNDAMRHYWKEDS